MKRRLIITLISIALAMHGAVPMGLAASSALGPGGSLLVVAQVICTANGVVNSIDSKNFADYHHNCSACSTPCQGSALVGPVLASTILQGREVLVSPVSFAVLKVNHECGSARSRAPPLILRMLNHFAQFFDAN